MKSRGIEQLVRKPFRLDPDSIFYDNIAWCSGSRSSLDGSGNNLGQRWITWIKPHTTGSNWRSLATRGSSTNETGFGFELTRDRFNYISVITDWTMKDYDHYPLSPDRQWKCYLKFLQFAWSLWERESSVKVHRHYDWLCSLSPLRVIEKPWMVYVSTLISNELPKTKLHCLKIT